MKVLSLFDGMSCGRIALREMGITPEVYYASEIDRHAIAQTRLNFPDTVFLGDVERWREWDIDWEHIDLVMGGSPCQGFSFAGKQLAFDDPRSRLFFVFAEILDYARRRNPRVKFLLENVNMKKDHLRIISERVGVYPVNINSALVSAQNRNRWYWTDIRTRREGLFGELYSDIPQPDDRGIFLRDILEPDADGKYYLSDAALKRALRKDYSHPKVNPEKAGTLNTKNNSGQASFDSGTTFISIDGKAPAQRASTGRSYDKKHNYQFIRLDYDGNIRKEQDKAGCLTVGGHGAGNHSDMDLILQLPRGYNRGGLHAEKSPTLSSNAWERNNLVIQQLCLTVKRTEYGKKIRRQYEAHEIQAARKEITRLEPRTDGKTGAITTVQKDNLVIQLNGPEESGGVQPYQQNRVYDPAGKSPALMAEMSCGAHAILENTVPTVHNMMPRSGKAGKGGTGHLTRKDGKTYCLDTGQTNAVEIGPRIRRLTPTECARLQTVPSWYRWDCSETQQYRMLGNGWTVEVIKHILNYGKWR